MQSMLSMMRFYQSKGWTAAPHLYIAAEAPDPTDIGIWQMTPLTHVGVHAVACNSNHLGVENVGDFEARPPSATQYQWLLDVNEVIMRCWSINASDIHTHKECVPGRTCPGRYLPADKLRSDLQMRLRSAPIGPAHYIVTVDDAFVRTDPWRTDNNVATFGINGPKVILPRGFKFVSDRIDNGEMIGGDDRWIHIKEPAEWGWIHNSIVSIDLLS